MSSNSCIRYSFAYLQLRFNKRIFNLLRRNNWCVLHRLLKKLTLSSRISRRVASGIAAEADIFVHVQCIITTSYTKHQNIMISLQIQWWFFNLKAKRLWKKHFISVDIQLLASNTLIFVLRQEVDHLLGLSRDILISAKLEGVCER